MHKHVGFKGKRATVFTMRYTCYYAYTEIYLDTSPSLVGQGDF